jgi:hypothetical protein
MTVCTLNIEKILLKNMWTILLWTKLLWTKKIVYINVTSIQSNMLIHHETYTRASQDKRRNSVATKWAEKVSRIWNRFIKINFIKFKLKVESSRATKTILYSTNIFSRSKFPTFPMFSFKNLRKTPLRYDLSRDVPQYPRTTADKGGVTLYVTWLYTYNLV